VPSARRDPPPPLPPPPPQPTLEEGARLAAHVCATSGASRSRREEHALCHPPVATVLPSRRWQRDQTVGIHAYSLSAAIGLGWEAASRIIAWCENRIFALAQVVANPRAVVGPPAAERFCPARGPNEGGHPSACGESTCAARGWPGLNGPACSGLARPGLCSPASSAHPAGRAPPDIYCVLLHMRRAHRARIFACDAVVMCCAAFLMMTADSSCSPRLLLLLTVR
jgi:hypothetical protein